MKKRLAVLCLICVSALLFASCNSIFSVPEEDDPFSQGTINLPWTVVMPKETTAVLNCTFDLGDVVTFGAYPQAELTDEALQKQLDALGKKVPSKERQCINGRYYTDVTLDGARYRGVYFNKSIAWYRFDPIRWKVLALDGETSSVLLMAESVLTSMNYAADSSVDGANNYKNSAIRDWLNGTFLAEAFSAAEQEKILRSTVENGPESARPADDEWNGKSNPYLCEDTEDPVFLFSEREVTSTACGFSPSAPQDNPARVHPLTGYSRRISGQKNYSTGSWWLRSPAGDASTIGKDPSMACICTDGGNSMAYTKVNNANGVVPGIRVKIDTIPELQSVSVEKLPEKLEYSVGERLDPAGMLLQKHYKNGGTVDKQEDYTCVPSVFLQSGEQTVTVTCGAGTARFSVNVRAEACQGTLKTLDTVTLGSYPQSLVTDMELCSTLLSQVDALPTAEEPGKWKIRTATDVLGENHTLFTIDITEQGERYCGVCGLDGPLGDSQRAGATKQTVYWFRYEPLRWKVLQADASGKIALLLCLDIIDAQLYHPSSSEGNNGNYANSYVRQWLNEIFLNAAFSEENRKIMRKTRVKNDLSSASPDGVAEYWHNGTNPYLCEDTEDYLFLPSLQQVTKRDSGFTGSVYCDGTRQKQATDFAWFCGCGKGSAGDSSWWLRSPYPEDKMEVYYVSSYEGSAIMPCYAFEPGKGVVPAMMVHIP